MPDTTLSTLDKIRVKIRRLTRSPSLNQMSDAEIDTYINTFVIYDFPEQLRLFALRKTFTFYTQPYVDTYTTNVLTPTDPLYNFSNNIISIHEPFYIAGYKSFFSQSTEQFYGIYPKINSIVQLTTGNGVTTTYTGTLQSKPVLRNNIVFTSIDANGNPLTLVDVPFTNTTGNLVIPNAAAPAFLNPVNNINYVTGVYTITFPGAPANAQGVYSETVSYQAAMPLGVLYFDNTFTLRPVPNLAYRVQCEAFIRPTELITANQSPDLAEWWQYIAYGASKKIFEDRMDTESIQNILPEFKQQERLILRRTLVQQGNERTASIYTEQVSFGPGSGGWGWGGGLY